MLKRLRIQNFKGWKDALMDIDITVHFLCPEYVKTKHAEKIGA